MTWRVGTENPHALYADDHPVGFVLNPPVAERIVVCMNAQAGASPDRAEVEQRVLDALQEALKRLGDDPPYYECDAYMCGDLARFNPELVNALNAFTAHLAACAAPASATPEPRPEPRIWIDGKRSIPALRRREEDE